LIYLIAMALASDPVVVDVELDEISGMETRSTGGFWVVEDSGNSSAVYAVGPNGEAVGAAHIVGQANRDWEDLSSYRDASGRRMLLIADTGDNDSEYAETFLVAVPEDRAEQGVRGGAVLAEHVWQLRLSCGAVDIEAVAVHPTHREVYLLTKRESPPVLWAFSLDDGTEARRIGEVAIPPATGAQRAADLVFGHTAHSPTAMDFTADGSALAVQTYTDAWRLSVGNDGVPITSLAVRMPVPKLEQTESACASEDGGWWVTSEHVPAPLVRVPLSTLPQR
jgi:hypothetical protein